MKCPINSQPEQPKIQPPQGSKTARQVLDFFAELKQKGGVVSQAKEIEVTLSREFAVLAASVANIPVFTKYSKVENVLATALGFKSTVLQAVDLSMTEAGATRYLLQSKAKEAVKLLQLSAVNKSIPKIQELYGELQKALPLVDKQQLQTILHDHIIIGMFPKLQNIYDSPVVRIQLAQRYQEHTGRLLNQGLSAETIKTLDALAGEIAQSFDNARFIAGKYGLDIKALENGGYFPVQATETIKKLMDAANETSRSNVSKQVFDTASVLNSSRASTMPAVLSMEKLAQVLGMSEFQLANMMTEPGSISKFLRDKFKPEQLQKLYDNGTLTQMPALSDELVTFFAEELDMPIQGLADAIIVDPVRALKKYNQELAKAVENSAVVQTAFEEGINNGWVIDAGQLATLGNKKDYVKIGSDKFFQELFVKENLRESIANLYMHRTVADQVKALTQANSSLLTLGLIGSGLQTFLKFTGFTKRSMIAAAGLPYVGRVYGQNAVSINAATGSKGMFQYANGIAEVMIATTTKPGSSNLSQDFFAKVGSKDFSLQELFDTTFVRRASNSMSGTGDKIDDVGSAGEKLMDLFDPVSRQRFARHMEVYHQRYGSPLTGKIQDKAAFVAELTNNSSKWAYEQLAKANQLLDFAARWTIVRTVALDPSVAGRKSWDSIDELLRYTDEYIGINDDVGSIGQAAGQFLVPFASFALVAPGMALRHALRHPWRYANMMKLYAQTNANNDLTDAELSEFQKDSYPVFIGRDPETGKRWSVNPGSIDSFLDTKTWVEDNFSKLARAMGAEVGSVSDIVSQKVDPTTDMRDSLNDIFKRTYLTEGIGAFVFGVDPSTGEKFNEVPEQDTLLGFGITRQLRAAILETLPVLRSLDRNLPSFIVGESPVQDPVTLQNLREGKPGFLGKVPTTGGKAKEKNIDAAGVVGWILNTGGLTLTEFDPNANLIRTYNDFGYRANELKNARNRLEVKINSMPKNTYTDSLREERLRLLQIEGLLEYNQLLVNRLAIEKGYTLPKALAEVRRTLTTVSDIPQEARIEFMRQQLEK